MLEVPEVNQFQEDDQLEDDQLEEAEDNPLLETPQIPLRPCFGITSNKSQGQTLKRVGIYLDRPFFSHGQYYVAQSRVGESTALKILVVDGTIARKQGIYTDNVVYPEVLYAD